MVSRLSPHAWRGFLVLSGLVPGLGLLNQPADPQLLIYTAFVLACLCRQPLAAWADRVRGPLFVRVLLSFWLAGALTEWLAWSNNYLKAAEPPALFHPQLLADEMIGLGFYGGWAVAWGLACRWFRFTLAEAFVITGLQGIFFEQLGAVFRQMMQLLPANPALALVLGLYVFVVHGSAAGLALVPVLHRLERPEGSRHPVRFAVVVLLMVTLAFAGALLVGAGAALFGGLPAPRSIVEHPLW